ncbi:hypothetical protein MASR2M52_13030 [Pedobacter sp.]
MDEKLLGQPFMLLLQTDKPSYSGRSNEFIIQKKYIQFDIDASYDPFRTSLNLWFDGKIIRSHSGRAHGKVISVSWDVSQYRGKKVHLQIVDADEKPEKNLKVFEIVQTDEAKNKATGLVTDEVKNAKEFAAKAIKGNLQKAAADEDRPIYHFRPPSQRMNDPNGTFYANGYYHLFYQHNPLADFSGGGYMLWGHARSKDMVTWEQLPIALWPDWELGELQCYSGDAYEVDGKTMLFYTGVFAPGEPRQQLARVAVDKDFIQWKNYLPKPVIKFFPKGGENPGLSWRDPYLFEEAGKTFALLTTSQGVSIYEATNKKLDDWTFKNVIYKTKGAPECPNFFRFGNKWMLLVSPQNPVEYAIGTFNAQKGTFDIENKGVLNGNPQYYATQGLVDSQGNQILFGLVKGFKNGKGWRDCLTLPRILSLDKDGNPLQYPLPALKSLRKSEKQVKDLSLASGNNVLEKIKGDVLELEAEFEVGTATALGLRLRCNAEGKNGFEIKYENGQLILPGTKVESIPLQPINGKINFHVFIDKGVIEIYTGNGRIAELRVFYAGKGNNNVTAFADKGTAKLKLLKAYELKEANDLNWDGKI